MNKQIEEIKKEFEEEFAYNGALVRARDRQPVWDFIEQTIAKSNEEARKKGFADGISHAVGREVTRLTKKRIKEEAVRGFAKHLEDLVSDGRVLALIGEMPTSIAKTYLTQKEEV